jgi:hypothetical protein
MQHALRGAFLFTIIGYGAPKSDVKAVELLSQGWGDPNKRELEQIEIIDLKQEDELLTTWDPFIHSHHRVVLKSFYDSWIATHPRRSCEAAWQQFLEAKFLDFPAFPSQLSREELHRVLADRKIAEP